MLRGVAIFLWVCVSVGYCVTTPKPPINGEWVVYYPKNSSFTCLKMIARIELDLKYKIKNNESKSFSLKVPTTSPVLQTSSKCSTNGLGPSVLSIGFMNDWALNLQFIKNNTKFVMNQISLYADFSRNNQTLDAVPSIQSFVQNCNNLENSLNHSLICKTGIVCSGGGLTVRLTMLQVQAYMPVNSTEFSPILKCSGDIPVTDWVPIVIGGVLASIVIVTLVVYLLFFNNTEKHMQQIQEKEKNLEEKCNANAYDEKF